MRVLLIEDDVVMAKSIAAMLGAAGMEIYVAENAEDGLDAARFETIEVVLIDLGLPDDTGYEVLRKLRGEKLNTPIVTLTGDASSESMVRALNMGADDFVSKPFHHNELIARIRAALSRNKQAPATKLEIGRLIIDQVQKQVFVDSKRLMLSRKEFEFLELLAAARGRVVSRDAIIARLYGTTDVPNLNIVGVYVCKLRNKLEDTAARDYIQTLWGYGYKLEPPEGTMTEGAPETVPPQKRAGGER